MIYDSMFTKLLLLFAFSNSCQGWWSQCNKYENIPDFCARLFSKEDCRGDAIVLPIITTNVVNYFFF